MILLQKMLTGQFIKGQESRALRGPELFPNHSIIQLRDNSLMACEGRSQSVSPGGAA